jgi:MFS family permease
MHEAGDAAVRSAGGAATLGIRPNVLQALLMIAGVACCTAMAMPQVHIVAYCGDLGYGAARGAEMLSLMLACGVVSRLGSGWITDRIGPIAALLLGSVLQMVSLILYLPFDGLASLYVVSALFGLFQGGIVPAYALIVREHFDPREAGARTGVVLMATLIGMALGGWMSGWIFDLTGSYQAAFLNGLGWNLVNVSIVSWLLFLLFDGLLSLYIISALFGLFQGGIVPSYAIIVREYFPAREAGTRVGLVLMATLIGMALGGWLSGAIFDATGSYRAAFLNGIAWNVLNAAIAAWLLWRSLRPAAASPVAAT